MEYLGLRWENFDFLYHDAVQLNHKNNWVVGGLGHTVHQACVTGDLRPLHQGLGRVTPLGGSISAQINRHKHSLYNMTLKKSSEPHFKQQKFISLRFEGDWKQHWGLRKILGNCGSKTLSYKNIRYSWLEDILYLTKLSTFSIAVKS